MEKQEFQRPEILREVFEALKEHCEWSLAAFGNPCFPFMDFKTVCIDVSCGCAPYTMAEEYQEDGRCFLWLSCPGRRSLKSSGDRILPFKRIARESILVLKSRDPKINFETDFENKNIKFQLLGE